MQNKIEMCSFCGKGKQEVEHMVAGPSVMICDECIKASQLLIIEKQKERPLIIKIKQFGKQLWKRIYHWNVFFAAVLISLLFQIIIIFILLSGG